MDEYASAVRSSAKRLAEAYRRQKTHVKFARSYEEFEAYERFTLDRLRELYRPKLTSTKFLKAAYFREQSAFHRHQDIPSRYFSTGNTHYCLASHHWETLAHPDPTGRQFRKLQKYVQDLPAELSSTWGFWVDYCCIPQCDVNGHRTAAEEHVFAEALKTIHVLTTLSHTAILFTSGYLDRSWCCAEWMLASSISPLLVDEDEIFPFGNAIKFRQLAIAVLFLSHDQDMQKNFLGSEDRFAIAFLNTLLERTMETTEATWGSDKLFINLVLHRHFWYHVRALGIRNQLAMAFMLLDRYPPDFVESLFAQFLLISGDPELTWTKDASFEFDTMLLSNPDPFKDVLFHDHQIRVIPHTRIEPAGRG